MGEQVLEDTRGLSDYLRDKDYLWGVMMGEMVYNTCFQELEGPGRLLKMFETLAGRSNDKDETMQWRSPITGFPVVHEYKKAKSTRLKLKHKKKAINVQIQIWEEATLDASSQKRGAAPNIVHSLDAVHLTFTVDGCQFTVAVVHDSFGCHAGNMDLLFNVVRQTFVILYEGEPLEYILEQLDSLDLTPAKGTLDVRNVLLSDFAFA